MVSQLFQFVTPDVSRCPYPWTISSQGQSVSLEGQKFLPGKPCGLLLALWELNRGVAECPPTLQVSFTWVLSFCSCHLGTLAASTGPVDTCLTATLGSRSPAYHCGIWTTQAPYFQLGFQTYTLYLPCSQVLPLQGVGAKQVYPLFIWLFPQTLNSLWLPVSC